MWFIYRLQRVLTLACFHGVELELGEVLMEHLHIGTLLVFEYKPGMKANPLSISLYAACRRVRGTRDDGG